MDQIRHAAAETGLLRDGDRLPGILPRQDCEETTTDCPVIQTNSLTKRYGRASHVFRQFQRGRSRSSGFVFRTRSGYTSQASGLAPAGRIPYCPRISRYRATASIPR
jgi:hypothetical protein